MNEQEKNFMEQITKWVVNDYFTPNIKAEVILDALLTPYIAGIIKNQFRKESPFKFKGEELCFVTKEMSVLDLEMSKKDPDYGNMGTKIDYILGDDEFFYLVELKTTDSSIGWEQARRYLSNCSGKNKTFGTVFGNKLLSIVKEAFAKTYEKEFCKEFGKDPSVWDDDTLYKAYKKIFKMDHLGRKYGVAMPDDAAEKPNDSRYADAARELIKKAGWVQSNGLRSRKYLYTMGQLLDYREALKKKSPNLKNDTLWKRPLKLIYLTPYGKGVFPNESMKGEELKEEWQSLYVGPKATDSSVSLQAAKEYLEKEETGVLAKLLAGILKEILIKSVFP